MFLVLVPFLVSTHHASAVGSTGVIVPLYSPPGSYWAQIIQAKNAHPSVPIVVIINPNSGPGTSSNADYATGISQMQASGITVLGYVYTSYGTRSIASVEADINSYNSCIISTESLTKWQILEDMKHTTRICQTM